MAMKKRHMIPNHLLGEVGSMPCAHKPCTKGAIHDDGGWQLAFCREHLEALPKRLFNALRALAGESVYDLDAVADAIRLVALARLALRKAGAK